MIQRVQSIFLFLVSATMLVFVFMPYWSIKSDSESYILYPLSLHGQSTEATVNYFPYLLPGAVAILVILVAAIELLQFSNRVLQIKLGLLNSLLMASVIGLTFWLSSKVQAETLIEEPGQYMLPGFLLPAISMVFNTLANRFIRKDEKLVRSVDRLR